MKLVRQSSLFFKEGKSDKVYEVDLCEISNNEYVVNFRYGKRGGKLKEGTKTIFPVPFPAAEKIFKNLVTSKEKKGYKSFLSLEPADSLPKEPEQKHPEDSTSRKETVLNHLAQAVQAKAGTDKKKWRVIFAQLGKAQKGKWKLSRVIWRAGEMKLPEAVPYLVELADSGDNMDKYCIAWSLGRCSVRDSSQDTYGDALDVLFNYYNNTNDEALKRIAAEGICFLQKHGQQDDFFQLLADTLPAGLKKTVRESDPDIILKRLKEYLFDLKTTSNEYLTTLYHISNKYPHIHRALLEVLPELPLESNYFKHIRHIFKAAEFREDKKVHGLLAYRFEKTKECKDNYYFYDKDRNNYIRAYSGITRNYMRKRIVRTLRRLGELEDSFYTELASAILLMFNDKTDAEAPSNVVKYTYEYVSGRYNHKTEVVYYDSYAKYNVLNYMLFANSPRYELRKKAEAWSCVHPYRPGSKGPNVREEAFPELWDKAPHTLVSLLAGSRCGPVHEFAVKAFRTIPDYETFVSIENIISMLGLPYEVTNELGLEIAKQKYSPDNPDLALTAALFNCPYEKARVTAIEWIEKKLDFYMKDSAFVCELIFSRQADMSKWTRSLVSGFGFPDHQERALITRIVSGLLSLQDEADGDYARNVGETLLLAFPGKIYELGMDVIRDMLAHPVPEIQAIAGNILLKHKTEAKYLTDDVFMTLLRSKSPYVRTIGVQLLDKLPDEILLTKEMVLANFCISEISYIRKTVKPIIGRLSARSREFADRLVEQFHTVFLFKEAYEGLHQDLYKLFTEELSGSLGNIDQKSMWKLIRSKYEQANRLGCFLLNTIADVNTLNMRQLIELANGEIYELREFVRNFYKNNAEFIRNNKEEALSILDSDWDDTRAFAFEYFRANFSEDDWTPELMVSICDSVREDVEAFGREMITRFFDDAHGPRYLIKLSQHPSADVQLYASNYLDRFAAGNIEQIEHLESYFITVLSQVNKGRVAKSRILHFLRSEAMKDESAARIAARVLTEQSLTLAIGDKASCIEILLDICKKYPGIETPVKIKQVPVYETRY